MDLATYFHIKDLHNKYGPREFGKIAQKLLALSLQKFGFTHIVERSVEGVDIDVGGSGMKKFALEVKTTEKDKFYLSESNILALRDREKDGYSPIIAALRISLLEEWLLGEVPLHELSQGDFLLDNLRPYLIIEISEKVNQFFNMIVSEHFEGTLENGNTYLDEQLRVIGIDIKD